MDTPRDLVLPKKSLMNQTSPGALYKPYHKEDASSPTITGTVVNERNSTDDDVDRRDKLLYGKKNTT